MELLFVLFGNARKRGNSPTLLVTHLHMCTHFFSSRPKRAHNVYECVYARITRGTLVAHRHSFAPPRCRTCQYRRSFVPSLCLCGTVLVTLCLMVWDWLVSRAEPMLSCWHDLLFLFCLLLFYFCSSFHGLVVWCWGLWTDRVLSLSPGLHSGLQIITIIIIICSSAMCFQQLNNKLRLI